MIIEIFTTLSKEITNLTSTFTTEIMQNIVINITPIVFAGLVLYFTVYGALIMNQTIQEPLNDFLLKMFTISLITSIALTSGIYQDKIADIIISFPDDFAKIAFNSADDTFSVADSMMTSGFEKANEIYSSSAMLDIGDKIAKFFIAAIVGISTVAIGGIGGALLLLIKINCVILASIGPLFIVALLFKPTRQFFSNWLGEIIGYSIFALMLTIVFIFILKISEKYLSQIQSDDNVLIATLVFLTLVIVSAFLFFECKKMAQRLSGVFSMGIAGATSDMTGNFLGAKAKQLGVMTAKGVGSTIKSGAKGAYQASKHIANKSTGWRRKRD